MIYFEDYVDADRDRGTRGADNRNMDYPHLQKTYYSTEDLRAKSRKKSANQYSDQGERNRLFKPERTDRF